MTDLNNVTPEQLQQLLAMAQGQQQTGAMPMQPMMQMPMQQPMMQPQPQLKLQGVSIPVSVQTPMGKVRTQFILPAEYGANPMMLQQGIQALMMMGYDIDAWQGLNNNSSNTREGSWGNSNNGSWGNKGGWNKGGRGW